MARHVLKESPTDQYCKGMLAEILEPIMGKGLIPADPATWKVRAECDHTDCIHSNPQQGIRLFHCLCRSPSHVCAPL